MTVNTATALKRGGRACGGERRPKGPYQTSVPGTNVSLVRGRLIAKVLLLAVGFGLGAGFLLLCLSVGAGLVYIIAVRSRLIAKVLPWAAGFGSGLGFLLLCLRTGAGLVYTASATALSVLAAWDLVFVLLTGRLRLAASKEPHEEFRATELRTGPVAGSLLAATVLALLIVGALPVGFGHPIRTGLSWYAVHGDDLRDNLDAVIADSLIIVAAVAETVALGRAVRRRNWGRALACMWAFLCFWSLTTASAGGWAISRSHQWWWVYPWGLGWFIVAIVFASLAVKAEEVDDRKQIGLPTADMCDEIPHHAP